MNEDIGTRANFVKVGALQGFTQIRQKLRALRQNRVRLLNLLVLRSPLSLAVLHQILGLLRRLFRLPLFALAPLCLGQLPFQGLLDGRAFLVQVRPTHGEHTPASQPRPTSTCIETPFAAQCINEKPTGPTQNRVVGRHLGTDGDGQSCLFRVAPANRRVDSPKGGRVHPQRCGSGSCLHHFKSSPVQHRRLVYAVLHSPRGLQEEIRMSVGLA